MKLTRDLTAPNQASGILYFEAGKARGLLPGDATAETVVAALKKYGIDTDAPFDFVDVPHHGSNCQFERVAVRRLQVGVAAVSTDGKGQGAGYCHPDPAVLELLKTKLDNGQIGEVVFTYKTHNQAGPGERKHPVQTWLPDAFYAPKKRTGHSAQLPYPVKREGKAEAVGNFPVL